MQTDRESVISDFKTGVCSVLVATSVAARGLDVRDLVLVVNYDTPNHLEEYVHRCGRTGRAGAEGTAVTFLAARDDQYAPDLMRALKDSKKPVPGDLQARTRIVHSTESRPHVVGSPCWPPSIPSLRATSAMAPTCPALGLRVFCLGEMHLRLPARQVKELSRGRCCAVIAAAATVQKLADGFADKRKKGLARAHGSGFGGSGFRFNQDEDEAYEAVRKRHAIEYKVDGDDNDKETRSEAAAAAAAAATAQAYAEAQHAPSAAPSGPRHMPEYLLPEEVAHVSEVRAVRGCPGHVAGRSRCSDDPATGRGAVTACASRRRWCAWHEALAARRRRLLSANAARTHLLSLLLQLAPARTTRA